MAAAGVGSVLVSAFRGNLEGQVCRILEAAGDVGNTAQLAIGRQLLFLIDRVFANCSDLRDQTLSQIDAITRSRLDELRSMVESAQDRNDQTLNRLNERILAYISALPMSSSLSQVTEVHPKNILLGDGMEMKPVRVTVSGYFPHAAAPPP